MSTLSDRSDAHCARPPEGWHCTREPDHDGPCAAVENAPDIDPVARAMAEWSSGKPWDERHPNNRDWWRRVACAVMTATADEAAPFIAKAKAAALDDKGEA